MAAKGRGAGMSNRGCGQIDEEEEEKGEKLGGLGEWKCGGMTERRYAVPRGLREFEWRNER